VLSARRQHRLVNNYFIEESRAQVWLGTDSVWQHRTIETDVRELRGAGFDLTNLRDVLRARKGSMTRPSSSAGNAFS
jgi:hypothetical protein